MVSTVASDVLELYGEAALSVSSESPCKVGLEVVGEDFHKACCVGVNGQIVHTDFARSLSYTTIIPEADRNVRHAANRVVVRRKGRND